MEVSHVYILAKNEESNIGRSVKALSDLGLSVTVLDSGSTDRTLEIASSFDDVMTVSYKYVDHCSSYNEILAWHSTDDIVIVLDADMLISTDLLREVEASFADQPDLAALLAPIEMYWEGQRLEHSSMAPPKPFAFRGGRALFAPVGHAERLVPGVKFAEASATLWHDDRKGFEAYLATQVRYSGALANRAHKQNLNWRDKLRTRTPLMILLAPIYSYFVKRGFRDGKIGAVYALDRLIAEAIAYRVTLLGGKGGT